MSTARAVSLDSLKFRPCRESDYDVIVELITHQNWFILEKSKLEKIVQELDAEFYVLVDESWNGQIMGMSAVSKTRDGEKGMADVIVRDGFRGRGLGRILVENTWKLHTDVTVTWFSTTDPFYDKLGAKPCCGQAAFYGDMTVDREKVEKYCQENKPEKETKIVTFTEDRRQDLIRYDADARGYWAEKGVNLTIATSDYLAIAVQGSDERIVGYIGTDLEPAGSLLISGLYADDRAIAAHLLRKGVETFPAVERVRFYGMGDNSDMPFVTEFGHLNLKETHSRYSHGGTPVKIPQEKLYVLNQGDLCY